MAAAGRRLLLISYHFPPEPGVAAVRLRNLVRHLPALGWQVRVLAGPLGPVRDDTLAPGSEVEVVRIDPRRHAPQLQRADWALAALAPARRAASDADVALVSGGPFAPFVLAPLLRRPYVLDFRDPWSWEPRFGRLDRRLRRRVAVRLEQRLEAFALARAAAVLTVAPQIAGRYGSLGPPAGAVETLEHGWEPADFEGPPPATEERQLVYAGSFLAGERTPDLLLATARRVRERGVPLRVRVLGRIAGELRATAAAAAAEGWLVLDGPVPHAEAIAAMRSAAALWLQPGTLPFLVTGKVYEYLATGRPIVAVAPADGAVAALLERTGGALVVEEADAAEAVVAALDGAVPARNEAVVRDLAAPRLAERLSRILERAAG
jgi:glycosyltransferase involved in cell wall biosynthesis